MGFSGAGGKLIDGKTRSEKSRDTVPLIVPSPIFIIPSPIFIIPPSSLCYSSQFLRPSSSLRPYSSSLRPYSPSLRPYSPFLHRPYATVFLIVPSPIFIVLSHTFIIPSSPIFISHSPFAHLYRSFVPFPSFIFIIPANLSSFDHLCDVFASFHHTTLPLPNGNDPYYLSVPLIVFQLIH